jgi:CIC family chloride channel protein
MRTILRIISFFQIQLSVIQKRLSSRQFMILSSVLVGLSSGLVAVLLKLFVHSIFQYVTHNKYSDYRFFYLFLPPIGILISIYITRKLFGNKLQKGLGQIHYALAKRSSFLPRRNMFDQFITSCFTVGFGGSTGLEAPIVITGAAFGSNYSKSYGLNYKQRTILLACGISAGIAAAFNAPIAGVLFALEVLLVDIGISSFTLLIISAASGALISKIVLNEGVLLNFIVTERFNFWNLPFYILLGLFSGIMAVYHSRVFSRTERILSIKITSNATRWILASILLALLIAIFPPLFGEGYESLKILALKDPRELMSNSVFWFLKSNELVILLFVGLIVFLKSIATGLTIGGGGNGGNFAPSLFIGAYLGYFLSSAINLFKQDDLPKTNFMLVGMAGILSGLYHAPLTAIFLIAEITGGYGLMIPLMIVSSISFFVSKSFEPFPMDSKRLAKKGEAFTSDKDQNVLTGINMSEFIERDFDILNPDMTLRELVQIVAHSKRNVFPVLDRKENFIGIVLLDDIREVMFNIGMYDKTHVIDYTRNPDAKLQLKQAPQEVMKLFDDTGAWILPMFDNSKYEGFISKSNLFSGYRNRLKDTNLD